MNLPDYIKTIGEKPAATLFGVSVYTIRSWRQRARLPRPAKALQIEQATGGKVKVAEIYREAKAAP